MAKAAEVVLKLTADNQAYLAKLKQSEAQYDRYITGIQRSAGAFKGVAFSAVSGLGAGMIAALAPMALFTKALETINDASHLVDTADKIGITTDALQVLSFGFSQAGVDLSSFETGMEQFSKRIGVAATQGGKLADILKANGVAIRDSNGHIRSSESLLEAYADLVKNARAEQEKMLLVTEAFGRGGGDMLVGLNQGAEGIRNMKKEAEAAGGVIDEKLLRRAEEMGDRWEEFWRRFKVNAETAILSAIDKMTTLGEKLDEFERRKAAAALGTLAGSMAGQKDDVRTTPTTDKPNALDVRIAGAFAGEIAEADGKLVAALKARYGAAATKATIIPGDDDDDSGGRGRSAKITAAMREAEAVMQLIDQLRHERDEIGMTDVERAKSNALRQAGSAATEAQREEIAMLVKAIYREAEARAESAEAAAFYGDIAKGVLSDTRAALADGKLDWEDFATVATNALERITSDVFTLDL